MPTSDLNKQLEEMKQVFKRNARDLLKVTQQDTRAFDNGQYGLMFVKLIRRLETALAVDREILVVFSRYSDQQPRTIRFARRVISDEDVRLDPSLAIIVHGDPRGNERLRNWGRQDGLTVLPIYFSDGMPTGVQLERALSLELYSHDLFDVTGPVSDDSQFYGRRTEAQELARKLQLGQIHACLGIRKIGKTSIINRTINNLREYHDSVSIMVDCSKDDIWSLNASQLMWSVAETANRAIRNESNYVSVSPRRWNKSISEGREYLINTIRSFGRTVIVFMDEVDYITPGSPTSAHWQSEFNIFWRNFRAVYQEITRSENRNLSVLISGVSSKWFAVHVVEGVENAALSLVPEEYLSPLPRGAAKAMIKRLSRVSGLILSEAVRDKIAEVSGDIPFWVRKSCSYIHRRIDVAHRPLEPSLADIDRHLYEFVESEGAVLAQLALTHLFSVYPELESGVLCFYEHRNDECPKAVAERLRKYGIVSRHQGSITLSGHMMRAGFEQYLEERTKPSEQFVNDFLSSNTLEDWADDLAIVGKKRNILESKLKSIALQFLDFDFVHNKGHGEVSRRLLKVLAPDRKEQLARLSPREIVIGYTWRELAALIKREWRLFEPIFVDKRKFLDDCDLINVRPDAHAKAMDKYEFALYRRSLDRLSAMLEKKVSSL